MKLGITQEQAEALSEQGMQAYVDWCVTKGYAVQAEETADGKATEYDVPLWEIGEMVEYLSEKCPGWNSRKTVLLGLFSDVNRLCDMLWETCKPILEQQN